MEGDLIWFLKTTLLVLLYLCAFSVTRYLWDRRYLYIYSMKVPGPLVLPFVGLFFSQNNTSEILKQVKKLIDKYKQKIFKIWLGTELYFVLSDPEHVEKVSNNINCLNKGRLADVLTVIFGEGLVTCPLEKWKKHKKVISPIFNQRNLESFVQTFAEKSNEMVLNLERYAKNREIIHPYIMYYSSFETVSATVVGAKVNIENTVYCFGENIYRGSIIQALRLFTAIYSWNWLFNIKPIARSLKKYRKNIFGYSEKLIKETEIHFNMEAVNQTQDFKQDTESISLLRCWHKMKINRIVPFSDIELRDEVTTHLAAGSDSSSLTEGFMLTALGLYPDIQKKVYDEVINVIGQVRNVESMDLPKLKYTEMVIKETLRYFSPLQFIYRKVDQDITLGSTFVPKGSNFIIAIVSIHHDPELWPNPSRFDPDRFDPERRSIKSFTFIPFGVGSRTCIGNKYAMMYIKTVISTLIRKYEFFTDYKSLEEIELTYEFSSRAKHGFKLRINKRNN